MLAGVCKSAQGLHGYSSEIFSIVWLSLQKCLKTFVDDLLFRENK